MTEPQSRLSVIGIGASAGGLVPLRSFFSALPPDTGLTFVVVTHLSPEHESILAELLQPHTPMPVQQVTARVEMQPNHVYVIPPGKRLLVMEGHLDLADFDMPRGHRLQIDTFFRSLAEDHGDGGAVILSGSGSDGSVGIQSIKEGGGLILVQDPAEAEFDGMPKSAIATGLVDIVAPVAELAAQPVGAKQVGRALELPADPSDLSATAEDTLLHLLTHLRVRTGHDFSGYKRATILRRIGRRMQVTQLPTLTAYLHRVRQDPKEAEDLYRDLLIHVTEFFRDPEAWATLAQEVIPQLFTDKGSDDYVRVWTVGCATGEEAYGIAMLLLEHAGTMSMPPQIQVFASDLGGQALEYARRGVYPEAIAANVSAERLGRFFTQENSHYRVRDELRERVLFTPHNLLQDPPFSKLDLVLCRNLLIYLQSPVQERVFETFHYTLRPEGYLFLGSAESPESITTLFEAVNKQHHIYCRSRQSQGTLVLPTLPLQSHHAPRSARGETPAGAGLPSTEPGHQWPGEALAPANLLVDANYRVLQFSETAGRYLQHPGGAPTLEALRLVRPELQAELRAALFRAVENGTATLTRPVPVRFNGAPHPVAIFVRPVRNGQAHGQALVFFLEDETPVAEDGTADDATPAASDQQLHAELGQAQRQIQAMREKHETTVEELRAANEELQSTNEEYRSTLEELETSKEELQSLNEELQTVNTELRSKVEETAQANSDLYNLFAATEIATLFLDRALKIKRYTPRAADLFHLILADQGRPIGHLRTNLDYAQLEDDARQVLQKLTPVEREVQDVDGRWYQTSVRPYRTPDDRIDGVVITFVDITTNKQNELALQAAREYAESIVDTLPDALLVLNMDLRVRTANDSFYAMFQVDPANTEGHLVYELGNGQWELPELRTLLEEILPDNQVVTGYEVDHEFEDIGRRTMLLNGRRLDHVQLILLAMVDITQRKAAEEALRKAKVYAESIVETIHEPLLVLHPDLRVKSANQAFYDHFAINRAETEGRLVYALGNGQWDIPELRTLLEDVLPDSNVFNDYQVAHDFEDIGVRVMLVNARRLDHVQLILLGIRDITERKQAEEALRQSEERFRLFGEASPDVLWIRDAERLQWEYLSLAFETVYGYRRSEVMGPDDLRHWAELIMPEDREHALAAIERVRGGERVTFEYRVRRPDGEVHWLRNTDFPIRDESGHIRRIGGIGQNITEQKRAEEALRQLNETMEAQVQARTQQVRTLASTLTMAEQAERRRISQLLHDDLQQLLYGIQMRTMSLIQDIGQTEPATSARYGQEIYDWLSDAIGITRQLTVDLSPPVLKEEGVAEALRWLTRQMAETQGLTVAVRAASAWPAVDEDMRVLLFQIVRELLFNVVKHAGVNEATVELREGAAGELLIAVSDQGQGFDVAAAAAAHDGGFGLFSVRERLALFGGQMTIDSAPGAGTTVTLALVTAPPTAASVV